MEKGCGCFLLTDSGVRGRSPRFVGAGDRWCDEMRFFGASPPWVSGRLRGPGQAPIRASSVLSGAHCDGIRSIRRSGRAQSENRACHWRPRSLYGRAPLQRVLGKNRKCVGLRGMHDGVWRRMSRDESDHTAAITSPSDSAVQRPVRTRHQLTQNCRATATTIFLRCEAAAPTNFGNHRATAL